MSTVLLPATQGPTTDYVPELRAGDRLTRAAFERRYAAMPHVKKAELIEGGPASPEHAEFLSRLQRQRTVGT